MLDLVRKDVEAAGKLLLIVLPLGLTQVGTFTMMGPGYLLAALVFSGLLAFGSIFVEEMQRTEGLWSSLPLSRGKIVGARYLTVLGGSAAGLGSSWAVSRAVGLLRTAGVAGQPDFTDLNAHLLLLSHLVLIAAVFLPFYFRFGGGRGFVIFSAVSVSAFLVLSIGIQAVLYLRGISNPLLDPATWREAGPALQAKVAEWLEPRRGRITALLAGFSLAAMAFSALVSRRFYQDRDL